MCSEVNSFKQNTSFVKPFTGMYVNVCMCIFVVCMYGFMFSDYMNNFTFFIIGATFFKINFSAGTFTAKILFTVNMCLKKQTFTVPHKLYKYFITIKKSKKTTDMGRPCNTTSSANV